MAWTTPKTWVADAVLTAAELNTHLRDNLDAMHTWTSYTPTWTATGGTPTLGNGSLIGTYVSYGGLCFFKIRLIWGSTTTSSTYTNWTFTMPVGLSGSAGNLFNATYQDTSAATIIPTVSIPNTTTTCQVRSAAGGSVGYNVPFTWANTDILTIHGFYQTAGS